MFLAAGGNPQPPLLNDSLANEEGGRGHRALLAHSSTAQFIQREKW